MNFKSKKTINALLGAIVLHLLIAVFFMYSKISGMKDNGERKIIFEFEQQDLPKPEEVKEKAKIDPVLLDKMFNKLMDGEQRKNIGVNVSEKFKEEISTENYAKQLQSELEAGRPKPAEQTAKQPQPDDKDGNVTAKTPPVDENKKRGVFRGPTNIYYDLAGRHDVYLPVPVYKCQGMGKIVVNLVVDPLGNITSANIDKTLSEPDDCLQQAALTYAKRTRFNSDNKAPIAQKGMITYQFVAQ